MKAIIATLLLIAGIGNNTAIAAKPTTVANGHTWHVASESGILTIENKSAEPLDVLITNRMGQHVEHFTVQKGKKKLPVKELRQGNYNIKLQGQDKPGNVKLQVL